MTKEQQELVDYLRSHVWAGGKPSDEKLKAATLIAEQAKRIEDLELGLEGALKRAQVADIALLQQAREIESLKTKLTYAEDAAAKGDKARLCIAGCEQENKELREALESDTYLIAFDDPDRPSETFIGEGAKEAALRAFSEHLAAWECHLFIKVEAKALSRTKPEVT